MFGISEMKCSLLFGVQRKVTTLPLRGTIPGSLNVNWNGNQWVPGWFEIFLTPPLKHNIKFKLRWHFNELRIYAADSCLNWDRLLIFSFNLFRYQLILLPVKELTIERICQFNGRFKTTDNTKSSRTLWRFGALNQFIMLTSARNAISHCVPFESV